MPETITKLSAIMKVFTKKASQTLADYRQELAQLTQADKDALASGAVAELNLQGADYVLAPDTK